MKLHFTASTSCCKVKHNYCPSFKMEKFWREFEKYCEYKYPKFIKKIILNLCAIDEATITDISEQTIDEIEKIVNENKTILKDSPYADNFEKKNEEFKFLYGSTFIIESTEQIQTILREKKERKKSRKDRLAKLKRGSLRDQHPGEHSEYMLGGISSVTVTWTE